MTYEQQDPEVYIINDSCFNTGQAPSRWNYNDSLLLLWLLCLSDVCWLMGLEMEAGSSSVTANCLRKTWTGMILIPKLELNRGSPPFSDYQNLWASHCTADDNLVAQTDLLHFDLYLRAESGFTSHTHISWPTISHPYVLRCRCY